MKYISYSASSRPSLLQKAAMIVGTAVVAGIAIMFSAVIFAVLLVVFALAGIYLWWKTREIRKHVEEQMRQYQEQSGMQQGEDTFRNEVYRGETFSGEIIEGESIRVDTERDRP